MKSDIKLIRVKGMGVSKRLSILSGHRKLGTIQYEEFGDSLSIRDIRIMKAEDAKKGCGGASVRRLFELYPGVEYVTGRSLPESEGFWRKVGATFTDGNKFVLKRGSL
jgi:hypothetical protein